MSMSEHERRILNDLEAHIVADDPQLAQRFRQPEGREWRGARHARARLLITLTMLIGTALLLAGTLIGVLVGVVLAVVGYLFIVWALGTVLAGRRLSFPRRRVTSTK